MPKKRKGEQNLLQLFHDEDPNPFGFSNRVGYATVSLEGFYGTYGLNVFIGRHVTSFRLPIGSRVGEKVFHWSESWGVGGADIVCSSYFCV